MSVTSSIALHEPALQPRGVAVGEHLGEQYPREVRVEVADRVRHAVADRDRGHRSRARRRAWPAARR